MPPYKSAIIVPLSDTEREESLAQKHIATTPRSPHPTLNVPKVDINRRYHSRLKGKLAKLDHPEMEQFDGKRLCFWAQSAHILFCNS